MENEVGSNDPVQNCLNANIFINCGYLLFGRSEVFGFCFIAYIALCLPDITYLHNFVLINIFYDYILQFSDIRDSSI